MTPDDPDERLGLIETRLYLLTMQMIEETARGDALHAYIQRVSELTGLSHVDGLSARAWIRRHQAQRVYQRMIEIEDQNPALAAQMQAVLDSFEDDATEKPDEP